MDVNGSKQIYTYDELYQLTSETGTFCQSYTFDSLYNRLSKDEEIYSLNSLNQMVSHCSYDLNGNPIQIGAMRLFYDALDRLIRVETPDGIQTFSYDYLNRRLSQTTEGVKTLYFLYDGQNEIGSFDTVLRDFRILGRTESAEIGASVAVLINHALYVPIHDLQGNIATLIPVDHGPASKYRYSAFGEEKVEGSAISPWRFSSKRVNPLTGFINYGRRDYVPAFGRWLTPDPLGFSAGPNLYAFVQNDPLIHIDEYGLYAMPIIYKPWQEPSERMNRFSTAVLHEVGNQALDVGRFLASSPYQIERGFNYLTGRQNQTFAGWQEKQNQFFNKAEDWIYRTIATDRNQPEYLMYRKRIGLGIDVGSLAAGGYGLFKGGVKAAKWGTNAWKMRRGTYIAGEKLTNNIAPKYVLGADNINSGFFLKSKLSALSKAQGKACKIRVLPDGRIRYYTSEVPASNSGFTRGASYVTEWDPQKASVRSWMESYSYEDKVTRVHPKMINGQVLNCKHYPPTGSEIRIK